MKNNIEKSWNWLRLNWQALLFSLIGFSLLWFCLDLLRKEDVTGAGVVFGMAFLSFLYANLSRFKRFKGLGFEAELWEDKQKEAVDLIDHLREIVSIYSKELLNLRVAGNRMTDGNVDWLGHWKLYNDVLKQHDNLGQKVNLTDVKQMMDTYFLFDATMPELASLVASASNMQSAASAKISEEFPAPISEAAAYHGRLAHIQNLPSFPKNPFRIAETGDLAGQILTTWQEIEQTLKREFGVEAEVDDIVLKRLQRLSTLFQSRPVEITEDLIRWTTNRD